MTATISPMPPCVRANYGCPHCGGALERVPRDDLVACVLFICEDCRARIKEVRD